MRNSDMGSMEIWEARNQVSHSDDGRWAAQCVGVRVCESHTLAGLLVTDEEVMVLAAGLVLLTSMSSSVKLDVREVDRRDVVIDSCRQSFGSADEFDRVCLALAVMLRKSTTLPFSAARDERQGDLFWSDASSEVS